MQCSGTVGGVLLMIMVLEVEKFKARAQQCGVSLWEGGSDSREGDSGDESGGGRYVVLQFQFKSGF